MHGVKETSTEVLDSIWVNRLPAFLQTITVTLNFQDICYIEKHCSSTISGVKRYFLNLSQIIFFKYYKPKAVESPKKVLMFAESDANFSRPFFCEDKTLERIFW